MMSDQQIIAGCAKHDRRAQKVLYEKYSRFLLGICLRYASDKAEAEDILQSFTDTSYIAKDTRKETEPTVLDEFTKMEHDLRDKIDEELEPLIQECMNWELKVLHSANISYLKRGDATGDYHQPTLPLPLLKQEVIHNKKQFLPRINDEERGGYEIITMEQWENPAELPNQPKWRINWFKNYPDSATTYMRAPREIRIDPNFCPIYEDAESGPPLRKHSYSF